MTDQEQRERLLREQIAIRLCGWTTCPVVAIDELGNRAPIFLARAAALIDLARADDRPSHAIAIRMCNWGSFPAETIADLGDLAVPLLARAAEVAHTVTASDRRRRDTPPTGSARTC